MAAPLPQINSCLCVAGMHINQSPHLGTSHILRERIRCEIPQDADPTLQECFSRLVLPNTDRILRDYRARQTLTLRNRQDRTKSLCAAG